MNSVGRLDWDGSLSGLNLGPELSPGLPVGMPVYVVPGALGVGLVRGEDPGIATGGGVDVQVETDVVLAEKEDMREIHFSHRFTTVQIRTCRKGIIAKYPIWL